MGVKIVGRDGPVVVVDGFIPTLLSGEDDAEIVMGLKKSPL